MALLPIFKNDDTTNMQMQNKWKSILDPIISNPVNSASVLKNVQLKSGTNIINHKLGQALQGWVVVRKRQSGGALYDTQDSNQTPDLTLQLVSNAVVNVDLMVW